MKEEKMKLRFSNGKNCAVEFEANDVTSFQEQALPALRQFRILTERRVHRGEIHKTVSWFDNPQLGIYDEELHTWYHPGIIKKTDTDIQYYQPCTIRFTLAADTLEEIFIQDKDLFARNLILFWQMCFDTYKWGEALNLQIMILGDELHRDIENKVRR